MPLLLQDGQHSSHDISITRFDLHYSVFQFMPIFPPCKWWSSGLKYNGLRLKHKQDACQKAELFLFLPGKSMNMCMQEHFSAFTTQNLNRRSHPMGEHDMVGRQEYLIISLPECVAGFLEGFMCSYISKKYIPLFPKTMAAMLGISFGKQIHCNQFLLEENSCHFGKILLYSKNMTF